MQGRWDMGWDAGRVGRRRCSVGCSGGGTWAGQDVGRETVGRTGHVAHLAYTHCWAVTGHTDPGGGGDQPGAWAGGARVALCQTSPCPQLQERYPDQPMELQLWARRQPLLSCRPDALHGTLFGSAEAFVVLPNATRIPAFLLNIVSVWVCHGTGSRAWPQRARLGPCWEILDDAGVTQG